VEEVLQDDTTGSNSVFSSITSDGGGKGGDLGAITENGGNGGSGGGGGGSRQLVELVELLLQDKEITADLVLE
jgi:hypothetical protein